VGFGGKLVAKAGLVLGLRHFRKLQSLFDVGKYRTRLRQLTTQFDRLLVRRCLHS